MGIDEAIEAEAQAQAICMQTEDFARAYQRLRRQAEAGVRGQLTWPTRSFLDWPFFDDRHRELAARARRLGRRSTSPTAYTTTDVDAACRALVRRSGAGGWLRYAVPAAVRRRADVLDMRALCLVRETLARHDGLADFAFAMQGLGSGAITLFGTAAQQARATCRAVAAARRSPPSRCPSPRPAPTSPRMACTARARRRRLRARRREDLDLQRRHRRLLRGVRAHRRGAGRARHLRLRRRRRTRPGFDDRRAHRRDRAAPAGARCASTAAACPPTSCIGEPGEGFKVAMAHARRLPHVGRRGRAGLRAPRAGRGAGARAGARDVRRRRWPTSS